MIYLTSQDVEILSPFLPPLQARFLSVSSAEESRGVREMINETIDRLQRASVGTYHLGSRYALLLKRLWRKGDPDAQSPSLSPHNGVISINSSSIPTSQNINASNPQPAGSPDPSQAMMMPAPYDFNWLDLDAVGQFAAMDDHVFLADQFQDVETMWYGFGIESPDFNLTEDSDSLDATGGHLFF